MLTPNSFGLNPEVGKKRCSYKIRKFHQKTSVLESLFNKVADLLAFRPATFFKKDSNTGVFL